MDKVFFSRSLPNYLLIGIVAAASNLSFSAIVAAASGVSVVLGVSMKGVNALVGTAISASLLPPVVNCGLCFGMALVYSTHYSANEDAVSYAAFGGVSSLLLFLIPWLFPSIGVVLSVRSQPSHNHHRGLYHAKVSLRLVLIDSDGSLCVAAVDCSMVKLRLLKSLTKLKL